MEELLLKAKELINSPEIHFLNPTNNFRYERKFTVPDQYSIKQVEKSIKSNSFLFKEVYNLRQVNNIYFDTLGYRDYLDNVLGVSDRKKIRIRWYGEKFGKIHHPVLEVKIKKGLVGDKWSYKLNSFNLDNSITGKSLIELFRASNLPEPIFQGVKMVNPTLLNSYKRKYFLSANKQFRITLDFEKRFGKTYSKFIENNDLFIILDANIDEWNISGDQLIFLMNTLRNDGKEVHNIFIFVHQVIWWSETKFSRPLPNSLQNRAKKTNFWNKIEPLLQNTGKPVYIFAGDVGAFSAATIKTSYTIEYFYHKENNITYISSGMGGGEKDNFVIIDVLNDKSVHFRLIHLNGENIDGLGRLEDYDLPMR